MSVDHDDRRGLNRYNGLYLWMIIPMAIMQIGIFHDYWGDLTRGRCISIIGPRPCGISS